MHKNVSFVNTNEFIEAVSTGLCWCRRGERWCEAVEILVPEATSRSLLLFIFTVGGKAVDSLLESDNIFISATQEMRFSFQKLTQIHCHYFYIVVMIIFI
jgi:hypothetical protein